MTAAQRILVVDDDLAVRASLRLLLERHGYAVEEAADPEQALARTATVAPALVIQDMNFSRATSGREGLELLARLRARHPQLPVVLLTAWGSIPLAVEGMKLGAADFLTKPWGNEPLLRTVATTLAVAGVRTAEPPREPTPSRSSLDQGGDFGAIVGSHPRLLALLELVARVAPTDASVLVLGESGTGKELVAEALHRNSPRRDGPFVKVNLGGLPTALFESELFGHLRGAFTDAKSERKGRFELAHHGTIFLDEIGELEPAAQVKLLRVLQDRRIEPLGASSGRDVDVRVVAATNRDLAALIGQGLFREDLYYRLNLITLTLPALRERASDIPELARAFGAAAAARHRRPPPVLTDDAVAWLIAQRWPGNVRELEQTIERAVLLAPGPTLREADLAALAGGLLTVAGGPAPAESGVDDPDDTLAAVERATVARALERHQGNVSRAAAALGLSRGAFYRRLERFGLKLPPGEHATDGADEPA